MQGFNGNRHEASRTESAVSTIDVVPQYWKLKLPGALFKSKRQIKNNLP